MKALVTGGMGFVGSHLMEKLSRLEIPAVALDVQSRNKEEMECQKRLFSFVRGDAQNRDLVQHILEDADIDTVVHLAGVSNTVDTALGQAPAYTSGFIGLATVYDAIIDLKKKSPDREIRVLIASSCLTCGVFETSSNNCPPASLCLAGNAEEIMLSNCYHPYPTGKLAQEMLVHTNFSQFGIPFTIMRFATLFGPRMNRNVVTWYFIKAALTGQPMILHGGGTQIRQHTYIDNLVFGISLLLTKPSSFLNKTISIVPRKSVSMLDLARMIAVAVPESRMEVVDNRPIDLKIVPIEPSPELIKAGWNDEFVPLQDGISRTVEYYRRILEEERE